MTSPITVKQDTFVKLPTHVALIPDGNRRWARAHGLPTFAGHQKGYEALEPIVIHAIQRGIPYLTFWAFSTENFQRSALEVQAIMTIFRNMFKSALLERLQKNGVNVQIIGNLDKFPKDIVSEALHMVEITKENNKLTLTIGLGYGGREEIVCAVNRALQDSQHEITAETFAQYLYTPNIPDPDLIVRTSGEQRLSGFMPWQSVYSELYFTDVFWPDFTPEEFDKAVDEYSRRERRIGK